MMGTLLDGLTVVEGAAFVAGPSCGLHLAQLGATVIRFDQIGGGPDARRWPLGPQGQSFYWEGLNKGKKSIAIDLGRPAGRALAQRLACSGDGLFVTNFPVDGFLSHGRLQALRADLVLLRIMGWADGRPGVDYTINAAVGLPAMTGPADDPRPVNHVLPAWDLLAGAYGGMALLAAERNRRASGEGREIRLALSDLAAATLGHLGQVAEVVASGQDRPKYGNDLFGAFGRDFETADGARIMLVAITGRQWSGLVAALGLGAEVAALEAALGTSFADEGARFVHRTVLAPIVTGAVARHRVAKLGPLLDAAGVTWSRYQTLGDAMSDPALFAGNPIFAAVTHGGGLTYPTPGAAIRMPDAPRADPLPAPRIGEHSDEILAEMLGLDSGEIARLHDQGLVA